MRLLLAYSDDQGVDYETFDGENAEGAAVERARHLVSAGKREVSLYSELPLLITTSVRIQKRTRKKAPAAPLAAVPPTVAPDAHAVAIAAGTVGAGSSSEKQKPPIRDASKDVTLTPCLAPECPEPAEKNGLCAKVHSQVPESIRKEWAKARKAAG